MRRGLPLALWLLAAGGALAEAPAEAPLPPARAEAEPPARPQARPGEGQGAVAPGAPLALTVGPEGAAMAIPVPAPLPTPPELVEAPLRPGTERPPAVARLAPLLRGEGSAEPALEGPRGLVLAELLMTEPPPPPVIVGGWEGDAPPARPGTAPPPALAEGPAPLRPRARPLPPADPVALLPPEPDAPPAYAPGDRPDVLPLGPGYSPLAVAAAVLPPPRPQGIVERAEQARVALARGQVCGDPRLQGEVAAAIRGGGGCGIEEPVRLRSVDGVRLSEAALMDCTTAEALLEWVREAARPALAGRGGGLAGLEVMGHYSCRPRNNQAGARLSEHGRGRAIDIGAVVLADGSRLSVARDWPDPALREMHREACGIFSTTLGPGSDGFHEDHFHYDTARGRGPYCR